MDKEKDQTLKDLLSKLEKQMSEYDAGLVSLNMLMKNGSKVYISLVSKDEVENFDAFLDQYDADVNYLEVNNG